MREFIPGKLYKLYSPKWCYADLDPTSDVGNRWFAGTIFMAVSPASRIPGSEKFELHVCSALGIGWFMLKEPFAQPLEELGLNSTLNVVV